MISIIVPVYNAGQCIERCINSLLRQTYENIEVIVVDDGSTDNSGEIVRRIAEADPRVHYYYQDNRGVSAARNLGLECAKGEYIGFCDSDDWAEEDMFAVLLDNLEESGADISILQFYKELGDGSVLATRGNDGTKLTFSAEETFGEMCRGRYFQGQLWNKLFRREVIVARFDERIAICEDILFLAEALSRAGKVVFKNSCKYHYCVGRDSAMNKPYSPAFMTSRDAYLRIMEICRGNHYDRAYPYVCRAFIDIDLKIADKMCESGQLDAASYSLLRGDVRRYRKAAAGVTGAKRKVKELVFLAGRGVYGLMG